MKLNVPINYLVRVDNEYFFIYQSETTFKVGDVIDNGVIVQVGVIIKK